MLWWKYASWSKVSRVNQQRNRWSQKSDQIWGESSQFERFLEGNLNQNSLGVLVALKNRSNWLDSWSNWLDSRVFWWHFSASPIFLLVSRWLWLSSCDKNRILWPSGSCMIFRGQSWYKDKIEMILFLTCPPCPSSTALSRTFSLAVQPGTSIAAV